MPLASIIVPSGRPIRRHLFLGLENLGYSIADFPLDNPTPEDVLVLWNRLPTKNDLAENYEAAKAKVVIAEHGWIGDNTVALSLNHHNGAGKWRVGEESRWPNFGIEVKPWREKGEHVLVVPQRGIGVPPVAMPRMWTEDVVARLKDVTDREIVVRHPSERREPFEPALKNVHAVVVWASGAGIKSIVNGVPVFYEMPFWIGGPAARIGIDDIENPYLGERDTMLHKLSWAMWKIDEIASGEAFRCVFS